MALSNEDLQRYVGRSLKDAQTELESQGYKVHLVRLGSYATGCVPSRVLHMGDNAPPPERRVIISYNGDDPQHTISAIRQD